MKIPRCKAHWRLKGPVAGGVVPGCDGCRAEQRALVALAQKGDRAPLRDGDTYMVWLKDEGRAMMAQVFPDKGVVRLQPINRTLPPVFKKPCDIEIRGRVLKTIHCEYPAYC